MGRFIRFSAIAGFALAATVSSLAAQGTVKAPPVPVTKAAAPDTVLVFYFRSEDSVKTRLTAGYLHTVKIEPQDLKLSVRALDQTQRVVLLANVTNLGATDMVARFTVQVNSDGEYIFRVTGTEPGRDVTLRLTVPMPVKQNVKL